MAFAIGRRAIAAILALGSLPSPAHARGSGARAAPSFQAGPGMGRGAMVPFGHADGPRSAIIVDPRQNIVVAPGRARNVTVAPRQRVVVTPQGRLLAPQQRVVVNPTHTRNVIIAPQQRVIVASGKRVIVVPQQHAMMAHGHPVFVAPGTFFVVPQPPVFFVSSPYQSCIWCDELGCVRQTLDFCATFGGS
jgi:hypothetical protein